MNQDQGNDLEKLVRDKVKAALVNISSEGMEGRGLSKAAKDVCAAVMPGIANIKTAAVSAAVSEAVKDIANSLKQNTAGMQKICLMNRYENDKLEQYMRRDNLRIFGLEEEANEDEGVLEAKLIEAAADMGVKLESGDISTVHRVGKVGERSRTVIARFCHRKNRNEIMRKKELKKKNRNIYINEDLTHLRATIMKMIKERDVVKNVVTRDGRLIVWLNNKQNPVEVDSPADLCKVGITTQTGSG